MHAAPGAVVDKGTQQYASKKERKKRYESGRVLLLELVVDFYYCCGGVVGAVGLHAALVLFGAAQTRICISGAGFEILVGEASAVVWVGAEGCAGERSALGAGLGSPGSSSILIAIETSCPPLPPRPIRLTR